MCGKSVSETVATGVLGTNREVVEVIAHAREIGGSDGGVAGAVSLVLPGQSISKEFRAMHSWPPRREELQEAIDDLKRIISSTRCGFLDRNKGQISLMLNQINSETVLSALSIPN